MYNVEQIAKTCHAIHRAYCNESLLPTQPEWNLVDDNHKKVIIDSVQKILSGKITSKEQSHNNFVEMKKSQGWTFGNYSLGDKKNPRLVPFEQLNIYDKIKEALFFETVKSFVEIPEISIVKAIRNNHIDSMQRKGWKYTYWAFDLHSTVIKPNYEAGNIPTEFYPLALECLQVISKRPEIKMIMYTCSHPHEQAEYIKFFESNGISFDFVNVNPEVTTEEGGYGYYEEKPYFNVLFEDKAGFDGETDWPSVKNILVEMGYWNERD